MGCNCGGNKNQAQSWVYTAPSGQQTTYKTQVEANARKIREDHKGTVTAR